MTNEQLEKGKELTEKIKFIDKLLRSQIKIEYIYKTETNTEMGPLPDIDLAFTRHIQRVLRDRLTELENAFKNL